MIATVPKTPRMLRLSGADNVLVAIDTVDKGTVAPEGITALDRIGKGHKMASVAILAGEPVRKFGQIIGFATQDIPRGAWVHEHNTGMQDFDRDYAFAQDAQPEDILPLNQQATFQGIRRAKPPMCSMSRVPVACATAPAPRKSKALNTAWLIV